MKKRLLIFVFVVAFAAGTVFAWEPSDLTKYPSCMDSTSWLLNAGVGIGTIGIGGGYSRFSFPLRVTIDRNIALGDKKLPFFVGGAFGWSSYNETYNNHTWWYHNFSIGGRFGYHFNWGVDRFDTYAVATAGWIIYAGDGYSSNDIGALLLGVNAGARYFISDRFGFWAEAGFSSMSFLDVGLAFKF